MLPFTTELLWARRLGGKNGVQAITPPVESAGDEDADCDSCLPMAIRVPVPFHGAANLEWFLRTSESALEEGIRVSTILSL